MNRGLGKTSGGTANKMGAIARLIEVQTVPVCRVCGQEGLCNCRACLEAKHGQLNVCSRCADAKEAKK